MRLEQLTLRQCCTPSGPNRAGGEPFFELKFFGLVFDPKVNHMVVFFGKTLDILYYFLLLPVKEEHTWNKKT